MKSLIEATQNLGRALMLPIAVLPIAGLLLRLGQPDLMNLAPVAAAGDAIFSNLGLLFAIGVAVGLARGNHGAAGLAGVVAYLVAAKGTEVLIQVPPDMLVGVRNDLAIAAHKARQLSKLSVPMGLISGIIAGWLYNRYSEIKLPSYLAFFAGRRFVPIVAGFAGLFVAAAFGLGWPYLERGMDFVSHGVIESGSVGLFVYGVLNRILIVTGLHHILNNVAWFLVGDFNGVTGDLKRFFAGDPTAGAFMSGFFPVMMFGLPAACLAMYHAALPARRAAVGGMLLSMALTSFLTGVTEPIEFTFMFLAPFLYALHAVLTGTAMVVMEWLGIHLGFSFSAGFFDFVLNFNKASKPWLLVPVGAAYFALYYGVFRFCIVRFGLRTPGREAEEQASAVGVSGGDANRARGFVDALGGAANLTTVDACTTRLRLVLADRTRADENALRRLGARGLVNIGTNGLQVVVGPIADQVATEINALLAAPSAGAPAVQGPAAANVLAALGGRTNVRAIEATAGRLLITLADGAAVDEPALQSLGLRGVARPSAASVHLLHGDASLLERELGALLVIPA